MVLDLGMATAGLQDCSYHELSINTQCNAKVSAAPAPRNPQPLIFKPFQALSPHSLCKVLTLQRKSGPNSCAGRKVVDCSGLDMTLHAHVPTVLQSCSSAVHKQSFMLQAVMQSCCPVPQWLNNARFCLAVAPLLLVAGALAYCRTA